MVVVETAGTTDVHRVTATTSTETAEAAAETANAEGPAPALYLDLASRPREEEADTTTITTAKEAQTAADPIAETTTTLIAAAETEAGETAAAAAATVARARPRRTTETLSTNHRHLRRLAEDDEAIAARPRHLRPKKKARKKANFRKERDQKPFNNTNNESVLRISLFAERVPFFSFFCVVLLLSRLLTLLKKATLFAFFHLRFFGAFCTFSRYLQNFLSPIGKRLLTALSRRLISLSLSLSLSLFNARYIYFCARTR